MKLLISILCLYLFVGQTLADVNSTKGTILFDADANGSPEARLNENGLGIGLMPQANLHVAGNTQISNQLLLGSSSSATSNLHLHGTLAHLPQSLNSDTVLEAYSQVLADSSGSSNLFLALPLASSSQGRVYNIKKVSNSNNVIIYGSENIDASDSYFLGHGNMGSLKVISNGLQWYILSAQSGESTDSPNIVSITANDPSDDDYILDDGDTITIVFDQATNQPAVATAAQIDALLNLNGRSLGTDYSGSWSDASTLVITIVDGTGASLRAEDSLSIRSTANLMTQAITTRASNDSRAVSGDFGVFSPSSLGNLRLWLDGADLDGDGSVEDLGEAGLTGNVIDTWVDKSGGNTATAVGTEQPILIPGTLNGNAVIRFDGFDDHFDFNEVDNIRSVFMVVKEQTAGNGFLLGHTSSYDFHRLTGSPYYMYHPSYTTELQNGSTYLDGVEINGLATLMPSTYRVISIITSGNVKSNTLSNDRNIASRYWNGDMAEVILYSDPLSDTDRITVEGYLKQKWGLGATVQIASIVADDLDNADTVLSAGDNITFAFDLPTTQPNVSTKSEVDTLIDFGGYTFWTDYSGSWETSSQLVITANGAGSGNLPIGTTLSLKASGNLEDANGLFGVSTDSANLQGNWGLPSSLLVQTTPLSIANCVLWLDGDDLDGDGYRTGANEAGLSGNLVDTWKDKSGQSNHATSLTGEEPVYLENTLNGNAIVRFDGTDDHFDFPEITNIRSAFWVLREENVDLNFVLGHSSYYRFHRQGGGVIWHSTHTHTNIQSGNTYVDGILVDGTVTVLPTVDTMLSLVTTGNVEANTLSYDRSIAGRSWDGDIAEVILYSDPLSDAERQTIENYLRAKWGTP